MEALSQRIMSGDLPALSRGLTLVESKRKQDAVLSRELISLLMPFSGSSIRMGITGSPGVGKSSFIERFGMLSLDRGYKLAVLSVDPTSPTSGGSILGDKTRMEELSRMKDVFIRPSPSGMENGGVSGSTRDQIILCEAAGFNLIIVETVGVGQGETSVRLMVDYLLLLLMAGGGDELQGIKRGIMEVADGFAFTKSDQYTGELIDRSSSDLQNALHIFREGSPDIFRCSSVSGEGMENILDQVEDFVRSAKDDKSWEAQRREQDLEFFHMLVRRYLLNEVYRDERFVTAHGTILESLGSGDISPVTAAEQLIAEYFGK